MRPALSALTAASEVQVALCRFLRSRRTRHISSSNRTAAPPGCHRWSRSGDTRRLWRSFHHSSSQPVPGRRRTTGGVTWVYASSWAVSFGVLGIPGWADLMRAGRYTLVLISQPSCERTVCDRSPCRIDHIDANMGTPRAIPQVELSKVEECPSGRGFAGFLPEWAVSRGQSVTYGNRRRCLDRSRSPTSPSAPLRLRLHPVAVTPPFGGLAPPSSTGAPPSGPHLAIVDGVDAPSRRHRDVP